MSFLHDGVARTDDDDDADDDDDNDDDDNDDNKDNDDDDDNDEEVKAWPANISSSSPNSTLRSKSL